MWEKRKCCAEWDMAWFCDRCDKMMHWKTKGWFNTADPFNRYYCNECKEKIEQERKKRWAR